ncbi:hypothetical protein M422DRAFT_29318 [Sphaerobolus stellatus SS14]|nr:hypothetical protein M422DRAFT_29318 [Sphaerobolus stellatus SS14]
MPGPMQVKLVYADRAHTMSFRTRPTWETLVHSISLLFGIPVEKAGVCYVNSQNKEIIATSERDLLSFDSLFASSSSIVLGVKKFS